MNYGGDVMWWQIAIVAGVVLIIGVFAYGLGLCEGYNQRRCDGYEEMLKRHKERGERVRQLLEEVER